jgi:hypothetical protein
MYALLASWKLDLRKLEERIVPLVRHQPGFVRGVWCGDGLTLMLWTTEANARGFYDYLRSRAADDLESLELLPVLADAEGA